LDCPTSENEYDDVDTSEDNDATISIEEDENNSIVNKNGVTITSDSITNTKVLVALKNKDGIIIKSN
jgi:hypothetical protein